MKKIMLIIAISGLILNGCKKENLDEKYQPKGNYQEKGSYGNATLSNSTILNINDWQTDFDNGYSYTFSSKQIWTGITQDILDKGTVMVYTKTDNGEWAALPYSDSYMSSDLNTISTFAYNYFIGLNYVKIEVTGSDSDGSPSSSDLNGIFRAVAISAAARKANPNLDLNNYNEVVKYVDLTESIL